jgi:hypothetical protein
MSLCVRGPPSPQRMTRTDFAAHARRQDHLSRDHVGVEEVGGTQPRHLCDGV